MGSGSVNSGPGADPPPDTSRAHGDTPRSRRRSSRLPVTRLLGALLAVFVLVPSAALLHRISDALRGVPIERVVGEHGAALRMSAPGFPARAAALAEANLAEGHHVEILVDAWVFDAMFDDLASAERSITFMGYYCEPGDLGDRLTALLAERAGAGVQVLFLGDDFGCGELLDAVGERLATAGVEVAAFRPVRWHDLHRAQHRLHSRGVVIDGTIAYTGGFGVADKWMHSSAGEPAWRDTSVRFTGPAVLSMQAMFLSAWAEATGELRAGDAFFAIEPARGAGQEDTGTEPSSTGVTAGLLHSRPGLGTSAAERFLAVTIGAAERTLYISNSYFVPMPELVALLVEAAGRQVDVRLLLPGERIDIPSTRYAGRSFYRELLTAGVRIFEYEPTMMHAKTLVSDGAWVALGTLNLDNRSMRLNDESALLVHDPATGAFMDALFLDDLSRSREITLDLHEARPLRERLIEWLVRRVAPVL